MTAALVSGAGRAVVGTGGRSAAASGGSKAISPTSISKPAKTGRSGGAAGSPRSGSTGRARPIPGTGSSGSGYTGRGGGGGKVNVTVTQPAGGAPPKSTKPLGNLTPVPVRAAKRALLTGHSLATTERRLIVGEFLACMLLVTFGPLGTAHKGEGAGSWMKRASAILALFFVLGLITTAGKSAARAAAAFGGLVTVTMLVTNRDIFTLLGRNFGAADVPDDSGTEPEQPDGPTEPSTSPDGPDEPAGGPPEFSNPNPRPGPDGPFR